MRVAVVVNPIVGEEAASVFGKALRKESVVARWLETTEDDPGGGQTREALDWGADVVFACGGDGTVRECAQVLRGTQVPLGLVPAGTGNLLALNLGISMDPADSLDPALHGTVKTLDVGEVGGEVFVVMAGAGLDAEIMANTDKEAKESLGSMAYVVEGAQSMFDEPTAAEIFADEDECAAGDFATILVGNLSKLQGGVDLLPDAQPDDALLDLLALRSGSKVQMLGAAAQAVTGTDGEAVVRAQAAAFHVEFEAPTPYELDGEPRPPVDELRFEVRPRSINVCAP